jgi:hypothetical protein
VGYRYHTELDTNVQSRSFLVFFPEIHEKGQKKMASVKPGGYLPGVGEKAATIAAGGLTDAATIVAGGMQKLGVDAATIAAGGLKDAATIAAGGMQKLGIDAATIAAGGMQKLGVDAATIAVGGMQNFTWGFVFVGSLIAFAALTFAVVAVHHGGLHRHAKSRCIHLASLHHLYVTCV